MLVTDLFPGTISHGAGWTDEVGAWANVLGQAVASLAPARAYWNADTFGAHVRVGVRHGASLAPNSQYWMTARWDSGTASGYALQARSDDTLKIVRVDAGVATVLQSIANAAWAVADLYELEVVERTGRAFKNGVQVGADQDLGLNYPNAGKQGFHLENVLDVINAWQAFDVMNFAPTMHSKRTMFREYLLR